MQAVVQIVHRFWGGYVAAVWTAVGNITQHAGLVFIPGQPEKMLFIAITVKHRLCRELHGKHNFRIALIADIPQGSKIILQRKSPAIDHLFCIIQRTVHVCCLLAARIVDCTAAGQIHLRQQMCRRIAGGTSFGCHLFWQVFCCITQIAYNQIIDIGYRRTFKIRTDIETAFGYQRDTPELLYQIEIKIRTDKLHFGITLRFHFLQQILGVLNFLHGNVGITDPFIVIFPHLI